MAQSCPVRSRAETSGLESEQPVSHWSFPGVLFPFPLWLWWRESNDVVVLSCAVVFVVFVVLLLWLHRRASTSTSTSMSRLTLGLIVQLSSMRANRTVPSLISVLGQA